MMLMKAMEARKKAEVRAFLKILSCHKLVFFLNIDSSKYNCFFEYGFVMVY